MTKGLLKHLFAGALATTLLSAPVKAQENPNPSETPTLEGAVQAEEEPASAGDDKDPRFTTNLTTILANKFLLKGFPISNNGVAHLIPDFRVRLPYDIGTISAAPFINLNERDGLGDFTTDTASPIDFEFTYFAPELGKLSTFVAYRFINLPGLEINFNEIKIGGTYETLLNPRVMYVISDVGKYTEFGLSEHYKIGKVEFSPSVELGHNHEFFREETEFSHVTTKVAFPIPVKLGGGYVVGYVGYQKGLAEGFSSSPVFGFIIGGNLWKAK